MADSTTQELNTSLQLATSQTEQLRQINSLELLLNTSVEMIYKRQLQGSPVAANTTQQLNASLQLQDSSVAASTTQQLNVQLVTSQTEQSRQINSLGQRLNTSW